MRVSMSVRSVVVVLVIQCLLLLLLSVSNLASAQTSGNCPITMCGVHELHEDLLPIPVMSDSCDSGVAIQSSLSLYCKPDNTLDLKNSRAEKNYTVLSINYNSQTIVIDVSGSFHCSTPFIWTDTFMPSFSLSNPLLLHCVGNTSSSAVFLNIDSCVMSLNCGGLDCQGHSSDYNSPTYCCLHHPNDSTSAFNSCQIYASVNDTVTLSELITQNLAQNIDIATLQWAPGPSSKKQTAAIAGGVVGGVLGVSVVTFLLCCYCRRSGRIKPLFTSKSTQLQSAQAPSYEYNKNSSSDSGAETLTRFFSYEELDHATNGFSAAMELGGGGFGTVYKGQLADGGLIAVKKLDQDGRQGLQQFHNEVTVLSQVHHPNLVRLLGCFVEVKRHALLVYEFVSNGSLAQHLHSQQGSPGSSLPWETRLNIAIQTSDALMYLHCLVEPPIFHRDVKTTNILLDSQFRAKVADFGLSRLVPITTFEMTHISTAPQGTPGYLDPDYHQSYQLSDKSDVYSFGVVLMELITAKKAVDMARDRKEINLASFAVAKIQSGTLDEIIDPYLKMNFDNESRTDDNKTRDMVNGVAELAFRCLATEKDDRPSMKEVLEELQRIRTHGYSADPPNLANHDASSHSRLFGSLKEGEYIELDLSSYGSAYSNNKDIKPLITAEREQNSTAWRHSLTSEDDVWESIHSSPDHNSITQIWHEINLTNPQAR